MVPLSVTLRVSTHTLSALDKDLLFSSCCRPNSLTTEGNTSNTNKHFISIYK